MRDTERGKRDTERGKRNEKCWKREAVRDALPQVNENVNKQISTSF